MANPEQDDFLRIYTSSEDPYMQISHLGRGGFSSVDKIQRRGVPGRVYARKQF